MDFAFDKRMPIKRVAAVRYGLGQPPPLSQEGVPIIRATNIYRGSVVPEGLVYAKIEDLPLDRAPLLKAGEILVVRSGAYTGDSALVTPEWEGSAPGYDLRITPHAVDPRFLAYSMLSAPVLHEMDVASNRAAQPHLNAEELGEMQIPVPSVEEQRCIADFLDAETAYIDALCRARTRQAKLLTERFESALAGRVEKMVERYGWLRLRWAMYSIEQGWSPQCDDVVAAADEWAVLKTSAVSSGEFRAEEHKRLPDGFPPDLRYRIRDRDLLITRGSGSASLVGVSAVANTGGRQLLLSDLIYRLRLLPGWSPEFVSHVLGSVPVRDNLSLLFRGQSGQTIKLRAEDVKGIEIPNVPPEAQAAYASTMSSLKLAANDVKSALHRGLALLAERKQALITAAVTGQIDVTTARGVGV